MPNTKQNLPEGKYILLYTLECESIENIEELTMSVYKEMKRIAG